MKVSELTGVQLDWAVAKCEGYLDDCNSWLYEATLEEVEKNPYHPSTIWAQGGPIIEREKIQLEWWHSGQLWHSCMNERLQYDSQGEFIEGSDFHLRGPTPLIAAMRCFVASRLGDEVEIPKELMT